jgi:hypothetical protein
MDTEKYNLNATFDFVTTPDGSHPLSEWTDSVPQILGQFPAAALIYRSGFVQRGAAAVHEERTRESLDLREIPSIAEDPSFDPNHNGGDSRAGSSSATAADPLAFLVGPVEEKFEGDPRHNTIGDFTKLINRDAKWVKSNTEELMLDYGRGIFKLDTPKAQSIVGFFSKAGGKMQTSDLTLSSASNYGTVTAVSMDDKPLSSSHKVLVQLGAVVRPTGWAQEATSIKDHDKSIQGWKITNTGKMPWQVQKNRGNISVRNPGLTKATVLDAAGYPVSTISGTKSGGIFSIQLPEEAMYVILE